MTWTDYRLKSLQDLWEAGKTAVEIAEALGVSRNAVLGKAHRMNLARRGSPIEIQRKRFERLIEYVAERPDEHITIRDAAAAVHLNVYVAEVMWKDFIFRFAFHPTQGLELYP